MKYNSIWSDFKIKDLPQLEKDLEVDVLVIGGGITGVSTAYHLINKNLKVCLVERNKIGSGVTARTTGKLTFLQENIYSKLKKYHNLKTAKLYLKSQIDAIKLVKTIIEKENINCDFHQVKSYVFENKNIKKLNKELQLLKKLNVNLKETNILPNKKKVSKAIYHNETYVFHPLKYLQALIDICLNNEIDIFENTKIEKIDKKNNLFICQANNCIIKAKYVVLAMHYPYFLFPFLMPFKTHLEKSYIAAFPVNKNYQFSAINISKPTISLRYQTEDNQNWEIFLTNSHNMAIKDNYQKNFQQLLQKNKKYPEYLWSNKDIITNDYLPFIGALKEKNLFIATGYNTWGMTNGSLAGKIIADLIFKKENIYANLFNPLRDLNLGKILNFPLIIGSNTYSFTKSHLVKQKKWYSNNVRFEKRNGKNIAIYIDETKKEHIVYNLCPHLKCGLLFNEIEKTWDCPCHGSRFDIDGHCIEGPSNYDITYKE